MKKYSKNLQRYHGFSMVEVLIAIVLIGILGTTLMITTGNIGATARDKVKKGNAKTINRLLASIRAAGGIVADGKQNDVDTSSIKELFEKLAGTPPVTIDDVQFKLDHRPNIEAYKLVGDSPYKIIEPILGTSLEP